MLRYVLFLWAAAACGQNLASELLITKTLDELRVMERGFDGALGVAVTDVTAGRQFALNGDFIFPQASVIKVPILVTLFANERAGRIRFSDKISLTPAEGIPGSEILLPLLERGAASLTIRELIDAMIVKSDNTATNKLIGIVGMDTVNRQMETLGLKQTRLRRIMLDSAAARRNDENISTPNEMAHLFELIARHQLVDQKACREMIGILSRVEGGFREGLPLDTPAAVKTGAIPGSRSETGIVFLKNRPYVLSVMSAFIDDRRTPVPEVSRIVYRLFEKLAKSNRYGQRIE